MVILKPVQWNFVNGVLSPKYRGKTGAEIYKNGLESCLNMLVDPTGGLFRRPGFQNMVDNFGAAPRFESFEFADGESYLLIFTSDTIRIYGNDDSFTLKDTISSSGITGSQVSSFDIDQSFDVLVISHPDFEKKRITRVADTNWTLTDHGYEDGPWERINLDDDIELEPSGKKGSITITAKDAGGTAIGGFFDSDDVGRLVRVRHNTSGDYVWGCAEITAVNAATPAGSVVDATVQDNYEFSKAATANRNWRLGSLSSAQGFDEKVAFSGNRLISSRDNRLFGTFANDLVRYSPDSLDPVSDTFVVSDDGALDATLLELAGAQIRWIYQDQVLHLGTNKGHFVVRGNSAFGPLTPGNISFRKQSSTSCADIQPVSLGNIFFVSGSKKKLYRSEYDFRTDRHRDIDMTYLSNDILDKKVVKIVALTDPWDMIWVVLEDGDLACLTYDSDNEVAAWTLHRHALGKVTDAVVLKDSGGTDRLYVSVYDETNYHIERLTDFPTDGDVGKSDYILLDSVWVDNTSGSVSVISDLTFNRLNGKVPIVMDSTVIYDQEGAVSNGGLTLDAARDGGFHLGINYDVNFKTLPLEFSDSRDSTFGRRKQVAEAYVGLYKTLDLEARQVGVERYGKPEFRTVNDPHSDTPALFTGEGKIPVSGNAENQLQIEFRQANPAPLWVTYLSFRLKVHNE